MEPSQNKKPGGLSLRGVSITAITAALLIAASLLYVIFNASAGIAKSNEAVNDYARWYTSARDMLSASDYLTQQVQSFVITTDSDRMRDYFEESELIRRRDTALASIPDPFRDTHAYERLYAAMERSTKLTEIEIRAMALVCEATGYPPVSRPSAVRAVELSSAERAMTPEEQLAQARALVFSDDYYEAKKAIREETEESFSELIDMTKARQTELDGRMIRLLNLSKISILVLACVLLAVFVFLFRLAIHPILSGTAAIRDSNLIPVTGSKEFRHLATEFNALYEATRNNIANLSYEVVHDELTGLYNRAGYDALKRTMAPEETALLVIDIDRFKSINDTYGHDIGDRALKRVAEALRENFRSDDRICRIGGDEMAVLMRSPGDMIRSVIEEKTKRITDALNRPEGDVPAIRLSVGVALGHGERDIDEMFRHADRALYEVKENGGNTCAFYRPKE